ncbi:hypothetical protein V2J09_015450 [Rumex salicifolius]
METLSHIFNLQEQICYVQCSFCTTILLVSVPISSLSSVVTVKCGHCTGLLSVNMLKALSLPFNLLAALNQNPEIPQVQQETQGAPEKKKRAPSAYNCFIKEEIRRLKALNPFMTHKEAFSTAAKNANRFLMIIWARYPNSMRREENDDDEKNLLKKVDTENSDDMRLSA